MAGPIARNDSRSSGPVPDDFSVMIGVGGAGACATRAAAALTRIKVVVASRLRVIDVSVCSLKPDASFIRHFVVADAQHERHGEPGVRRHVVFEALERGQFLYFFLGVTGLDAGPRVLERRREVVAEVLTSALVLRTTLSFAWPAMKMVSFEALAATVSSTLIQLSTRAPCARSMFGCARLNSRSPMCITLACWK